jgi:hypothetical protein
LNHVKVESFHVKKTKKLVNYELDLFKDARVFLVFHISLLESVDFSTPIQETFHYKAQKKSWYEVEKILRQQGQNYLIKWKRYSTLKNTWEPKKNLDDCYDLIQRFHQRSKNHSA